MSVEPIRTRTGLAEALDGMRAPGRRVAVVMTMGALHDGHAALLRAARYAADVVVVTIFVNPRQFGAAEDLGRYPRTLDADLALCARQGADLVFAPPEAEVYPTRPVVTVSAGALGEVLEGRSRPGHFDGVLTVVLKLLHLVRPATAVFGEKDAQQLALVRRMVADLDLEVEILAVPTVREPDGLALSSRNRFLSGPQRRSARALSAALRAGADAGSDGVEGVLRAVRERLDDEPCVFTDYVALVNEATFAELLPGDETPAAGRLVVAARVGDTRLIDTRLIGAVSTPLPRGRDRPPAAVTAGQD